MTRILNFDDGVKINLPALLVAMAFAFYPALLVFNFYGFATTFVNAAVLALGVFSAYRIIMQKNMSPAFVCWSAFLFINLFYYLFYRSFDPNVFGKMASISLVGVTFYIFFYLSVKGWIEDRFMIKFFYLILLLAVFLHFQAIVTKKSDRSVDNVVVNTSYVFAYLVPFVFFLKK